MGKNCSVCSSSCSTVLAVKRRSVNPVHEQVDMVDLFWMPSLWHGDLIGALDFAILSADCSQMMVTAATLSIRMRMCDCVQSGRTMSFVLFAPGPGVPGPWSLIGPTSPSSWGHNSPCWMAGEEHPRLSSRGGSPVGPSPLVHTRARKKSTQWMPAERLCKRTADNWATDPSQL